MKWLIIYSLCVMSYSSVCGQISISPNRVISDTNFVADVLRLAPKKTPLTQRALAHHLTEIEGNQILNILKNINAKNITSMIDRSGKSIALLSYMLYRDAPNKHQQIPKAINARLSISWLMHHDKDLWVYPMIQQNDAFGAYIQLQTNDFFAWVQAIGAECVPLLQKYLEREYALSYVNWVEADLLAYQLDLQIKDIAYVVIKALLQEDSKLSYFREDRDRQITALHQKQFAYWKKVQPDTNFVTRLMYRPPFYTRHVSMFYSHRLTPKEIQRALDTIMIPDFNKQIFSRGILIHLLYLSDSTQLSKIASTWKAKIVSRWMMQGSQFDMWHWGRIDTEIDTNKKICIILNIKRFDFIKNIGKCCIPELKHYLKDTHIVEYPDVTGETATKAYNLQVQSRDFAYVVIKQLLNQDPKLAYTRKERDKQIKLLKRALKDYKECTESSN